MLKVEEWSCMALAGALIAAGALAAWLLLSTGGTAGGGLRLEVTVPAPLPPIDLSSVNVAAAPIVNPAPTPALRKVDNTRRWEAKIAAYNKAAEEEAYQTAEWNAARAECLRRAVDYKIAGDVKLGQIRDFGDVLSHPVCGPEALMDLIEQGLLEEMRVPTPDAVQEEIARDLTRRMREAPQDRC